MRRSVFTVEKLMHFVKPDHLSSNTVKITFLLPQIIHAYSKIPRSLINPNCP